MSKKRVFIFLTLLASVYANAQVAATINFGQEKQLIDGFGVSTAWHGAISESEADIAFLNNTTEQLGLSILRVQIDPNSSNWGNEKANALKAKNRGAIVFAAPWTPPAYMKTNKSTVGGELLPEYYGEYANHLKSFCNYVGNVQVVSLQNEPNIKVGYESCSWSPAQILEFCKTNAPSIGIPLMIAETYNFAYTHTDPILNDPIASANVAYVGGHLYGSTTRSYPLATSKGKKLWMTEFAYNPDSLGTCMTMAKDIMDCMYGNMNAFVYWYLRQPGCNIINSDGTLKLKGYTLAHFSKFIRPGYYRVNATYQPNSRINIIAFKGLHQDIVVVLNQNWTSKTQTINISNQNVESALKFTTSDTKRLELSNTITCTNNSFTDQLDARSINTYILNRAPSAQPKTKIEAISIFPNPATNFVQLSSISGIKCINITTVFGDKRMTLINPKNTKIDISNLPSGTYLMTIIQNGVERQLKFVKI